LSCAVARCGDGLLRTGVEVCDDQNTIGGDGCSAGCQFEITFPQPLSITLPENELLSRTYAATQSGGAVISWSATGLPTGATFDQTTATLSWRPDFAASAASPFSIIVTASDGVVQVARTQTVVVTNSNRAPTLSTTPGSPVILRAGSLLELLIAADDADGDPLTLTVDPLPTGASFDESTQTLSWATGDDDVGAFSLLVTVDDGTTQTAVDVEISIAPRTCGDGIVDAPSEECDAGTQNANFGACRSDCRAARCGDGTVRTDTATELCDDGNIASGDGCSNVCATEPGYACTTASSGLTTCVEVCGDGVRTTGEGCDAGSSNSNNGACTQSCTVARCGDGQLRTGVEACDDRNATDGDGCSAGCQFEITFPQPPAVTLAENEAFSRTYVATQSGGAVVSWSATGLPTGATFDETTATLSWRPDFAAAVASPFSIVVTASDGVVQVARTQTVVVTNTNRAPIFATVPPQTLAAGAPYQLPGQASDPDGDALTYAATGLPAAASLNPSTGLLQWSPVNGDARPAPYLIAVTATDSGGLSTTLQLSLTVVILAAPPVFAANTPSAVTAPEGSLLSVDFNATDPNGDQVLYSIAALPAGASFDQVSGLLTWIPGFELALPGSDFVTTVQVTATDGTLDTTRSLRITVTQVSGCGDGTVDFELNELCDDANSDPGDVCVQCQFAACGDGYVQRGVEACDDQNTVETDSCLSSCSAPSGCGDGLLRSDLAAALDAEQRHAETYNEATGVFSTESRLILGLQDIVQGDAIRSGAAEQRVNQRTLDQQEAPAAARLQGGDVVMVWQSYRQANASSDFDVVARRFSSTLSPLGSEFIVSPDPAGTQTEPRVAALSDGGFVVVYEQASGLTRDIRAMTFDAVGQQVGNETLVTNTSLATELSPDVAGLSGGGYVVAWQSDRSETGASLTQGVQYAVFDAVGSNVSGVRLANETITNDQSVPAVTALNGGGFAVAWHSTQTNNPGLYLRVFTAAGAAVAGERLVAGTTAPAQAPLFSFATHTFTSCGATGVSGPTLASCRATYPTTWDDNDSFFAMPNAGYQRFTVPVTGTYRLAATGAGSLRRGVGADLFLARGQSLLMVVGHDGGGTGSGGSFVALGSSAVAAVPLLVAGGFAGANAGDLGDAGGRNGSSGVNSNISGFAGGISQGGGGFFDAFRTGCVGFSIHFGATGPFGCGGAIANNSGGGGGGGYSGGDAGQSLTAAQPGGSFRSARALARSDLGTAGSAAGVTVSAIPTAYRAAMMASADGGFTVSWPSFVSGADTLEVLRRAFDAAGAPVASANRTSGTTEATHQAPGLAQSPDNTEWSAWGVARAGGTVDIVATARHADSTTERTCALTTTADSAAAEPQVVADNDGAVVVYARDRADGSVQGIFARRLGKQGGAFATRTSPLALSGELVVAGSVISVVETDTLDGIVTKVNAVSTTTQVDASVVVAGGGQAMRLAHRQRNVPIVLQQGCGLWQALGVPTVSGRLTPTSIQAATPGTLVVLGVAGTLTVEGEPIAVEATDSLTTLATRIQSRAATTGVGASAVLVGTEGRLRLTPGRPDQHIRIGGTPAVLLALGFTSIPEQCDDGNDVLTDGCARCAPAACGDGLVRAGVEQCDDGNASNTDACLASCVLPTCGDGFVRAGVEPCDDGNASNTDACLTTCALPTCGDGFVRTDVEVCDDSGTTCPGTNDLCLECSDTCRNESFVTPSTGTATCGDGIVQAGERCDDGNTVSESSCVASEQWVGGPRGGLLEAASTSCRVCNATCTGEAILTAAGTPTGAVAAPCARADLGGGMIGNRCPVLSFVSVPGAVYAMGSTTTTQEQPIHNVVALAFELGTTEVTVGQYRACVDSGACTRPATGVQLNWTDVVGSREQHPVNGVTWQQAKTFATWVGARLPTEAEWERAARRLGTSTFPWGDTPTPSCQVNAHSSGSGCTTGTVPVCSLVAGSSAESACDLLGNVAEWTADTFHANYLGAPINATLPWCDTADCSETTARVHRGGFFGQPGSQMRSTARSPAAPTTASALIGFRVGRSVSTAGRCGDGRVQAGEQCDDGNDVTNDTCGNTCLSPRCGDGVIQAGEFCDDAGFGGCSANCQACTDGGVDCSCPAVTTCRATPTQSQIFSATGAVQTFTVPAGVTCLAMRAWGASGATGSGGFQASPPGVGGGGAGVVLPQDFGVRVTPGEVLTVVVGGAAGTPAGGFGGTLRSGGSGSANGAGGGGASFVQGADGRLLVVAGGGGGGSAGEWFVNGTNGGGGSRLPYPTDVTARNALGSGVNAVQSGGGGGGGGWFGGGGGNVSREGRPGTFTSTGGAGGDSCGVLVFPGQTGTRVPGNSTDSAYTSSGAQSTRAGLVVFEF
jgi:cysteine-rich repeat protein